MLTQLKIKDFLRDTEVFSTLEDESLERLSKNAIEINYSKGKLLFVAGDKAQHFYVVKSGWIKLYRETLDGNMAIIDILSSGQIFGETALFESDSYTYSSEIVEDAGVIAFPLHDLQKEFRTNNALTFAMLEYVTSYSRRKEREIEHKTLQSAPQRIGCFLLRLVPSTTSGSIVIHLPYDKTLLAARLGMQPETFSRALNKLKEATGLHVKGATIEIENIDRLIKFTCSACSSEYPCQDKCN